MPALAPTAALRTRRSNRYLLGGLALLALLVAPAAASAEQLTIEIADPTRELVNPALVRRLIQLEVSEVEVPPDPEAAADGPEGTLYVRVADLEDGTLSVEMWARGQRVGARRVKAKRSRRLRARHIALAAAELANQLRRRRVRARRLAQERPVEEPKVEPAPGALRAEFLLEAGALGAFVGGGDFWLVGSELRFPLRFRRGPEFAITTSWLGGSTESIGSMRWLEAGVAAGYDWGAGTRTRLAAGAQASVAMVHLGAADAVDREPGQSDTWSARAVVWGSFGPRLSENLELTVRPELGATLRQVSAQRGDRSARLGGLWLGIGLNVGFSDVPLVRHEPASDANKRAR